MKKTIIAALVVAGFSMGALAQGSIGNLNNASVYMTTGVGNNTSASAAGASYYSGAFTLEVFFSSTATSQNASSINALNGTSTSAAGLLSGFGFQEVGLTGNYATSVGAVSGSSAGTYQFGGVTGASAGTVYFSSAFAANTVGYLAFLVTGTGAYSGDSTILAFAGQYGGNVAASGQPYSVNTGLNSNFGTPGITFDMTSAVPEPSTMALAGLGVFGTLMTLRRKKA